MQPNEVGAGISGGMRRAVPLEQKGRYPFRIASDDHRRFTWTVRVTRRIATLRCCHLDLAKRVREGRGSLGTMTGPDGTEAV